MPYPLKFMPRLFGLGAPLSIACVASAMILGVGVLQVARSYENAMATAFSAIEGRGKSGANLTDSSIMSVDLAVSSLAEDLTAGVGELSLSEVLDRRLRLLDQASDLIVSDDGKRWQGHAASIPQSQPDIENVSLDWHRSHPSDRQVHVETLLRPGSPGGVAIVVSKAIVEADGAVRGVVAAVLNPTFFETLYADMIVGPLGAISLWRDDGHVLIRYPPTPQDIGRNFRAARLVDAARERAAGSYRVKHSVTDGHDRLVSYRHLDHFPTLLVVTAMAVEDVVTPWRQSEMAEIASIALCVIVILGLGFVTARHRHREAEAARVHRSDEALFRGVFDNSTDDLFVYRQTGDGTFLIEAINPAAACRSSRTRETMMGQNAVDVLPSRIAARVVSDLEETIAAGAVVSFVSESVTERGKLYNEVVQVPLANADGVFDRVFVGARDITHLKAADARLQELNGRLLLAEQIAHLGHWRLELPQMVVIWSDEIFRIHGLDPSLPVPGLHAAIAAYHPDDRAELARLINDAIHQKIGCDFSLRLIRPDGEVRHVMSRCLVELAPDGEVSALFGTLMDTTDLTMVERRLEKQTALLQTTLAHMEQGLVMLDGANNVVVRNERAIALFGDDFPVGLDQTIAGFDPIAGSTAGRLEVDGRVLDVQSVPVPGGGVVLTFADVTERERTGKQLRDSEARYRLLAENTSELIQLGHDDGRRSYVSPAIERLLGFTVAEFSAMRLRDYVHPDDLSCLYATTRRLTAGETEVSTTYRALHKVRGWIWIEGVFRRVEGALDGEPTIVGTFRDIGERLHQAEALRLAKELAEQARGEAERASAAKTEFLASMSHEIRTPLTGVLGYTELLLDDVDLSQTQRQNVERIQNAGTALLTVVNDILDFSKIEAGQIDLDLAPFHLEALMDATVSIVRGTADRKRLALSVMLDPGLPRDLLGDQDRLRQILLNLLNNAIKFTPSGGIAVHVSSAGRTADGALVRFSVTDTGIGIPLDRRQNLFERFSQLDSSIGRRFGGTGLGLAISKSLVTLMGGTIAVESAEGGGSTFWFSVPLAEANVALAAPVATPVAASGGSASILLVDDLEINRDLGQAMLMSAGHLVDLASDGAEAIAAVQAKRYDLVLMDVQMPGMDGLTATTHIRALPGDIGRVPIVAMTANVLPDQIAQCRRAGMNDHVGKPIKKMALNEIVARYLQPSGAKAPNTTSATVLNGAVFDEMRELLGADALRKMLDRLSDHMRGEANVLTTSREPEVLATAAHKMVSMAGSLGFTALAERCADLERACLESQPLDDILGAVSVARKAAIERIDSLRAA